MRFETPLKITNIHIREISESEEKEKGVENIS